MSKKLLEPKGMSISALKPSAHVVDVLGNVIGRDQPILRIEKALEMVSHLGEEIFADENVVFFDPFCKAGELLLACAFLSCQIKSKKSVLDIDVVIKEIYESNRYYGMAPDERHHRLSLRTFLGNSESHNGKYNHIIRDGHYVSEKDGCLDQEKFVKEFNSMIEYIKSKAGDKKIVAVGNPPYQEEDGGAQKSAKPIYNLFVEKLIEKNEIKNFILVIPSRWFGGGKGLDGFRALMMNSPNLKSITHFGKSGDVFPTVDIDGGVCFINLDKSFQGKTILSTAGTEIELDNERFDIIPDDPGAYPILEKINKKWDGQNITDIAWPRKAFGLGTNFFDQNKECLATDNDVIACVSRNRTVKYLKKSQIPKNVELISKYKVCAPKAYGGQRGDRRITLPKQHIFLIEKDFICTETYNVIGAFTTKKEALSLISYLQTDFSRYLLGLRKITQDIPRERWKWIPLLDLSIEWTNESLAQYFNLTEKEKEHIKKKVKEWS